MPRRVIGQCNRIDFTNIEHLASVIDNPEQLDTSTLTSREKFAFIFLAHTGKKNIPYSLVKEVVKEVIFYGDGDMVTAIEIKFLHIPSRVSRVLYFRQLWN